MNETITKDIIHNISHIDAKKYSLILNLALLAVALAIFVGIALHLAPDCPLALQDMAISRWVQNQTSPSMTALMRGISALHGALAIIGLAILVGLHMWHTDAKRWIVFLLASVPLGFVLNTGLKHFFHRARPQFDLPLVTLHSYSFPSGHTFGSAVFYGVLALYLVRNERRTGAHILIFGGALCLTALVAVSRVYLGAHYLSDVLAASALGIAWVSLWFMVIFHSGWRTTALKHAG
ncbi:phosphatase PAP2 family protein [Herbaspirillum sp. RTI4]|uniref:phosphatase PAP2 family protein n=1 Tax=Herbaspirillum sp. RTI4 TaxID=3048640 RepID=UPI002AB3A5D7|nr:phosphatase PAP2 family protein [Herbaspirillum sp. RTI4]MDY7578859.1 phosphatase PAP2 family protein [Herbaspirillum sp. RTI4]MEA9983002.1 phosphatase PAP2 family protein [Herbaspirillum sp. RTI4]